MMRLREIITNWIINTSIFEMAHQRKRAIEKITDLQDSLADHLIKVIIFPYSQPYNHWCKEINAILKKINLIKIKPYGDRLFQNQLFDILFDEPLGTERDLTDRIDLAKLQYSRLKMTDMSLKEIQIQLMNTLNEICKDLSLGEVKDVRNYL